MATGIVQTEIEKFLGQGTVPLYIGGAWRAAHGGEVIEVKDPANGTFWPRSPRAKTPISTTR